MRRSKSPHLVLEGNNLKTLIFVLIFFSGSYISSMNSTENRQVLVEASISNINLTLNDLKKLGESGDIASLMAYEMYLDLRKHEFPRHIGNVIARNKLVNSGLCRLEDSILVLLEYPISDELQMLKRSLKPQKMDKPKKRINDGKQSD